MHHTSALYFVFVRHVGTLRLTPVRHACAMTLVHMRHAGTLSFVFVRHVGPLSFDSVHHAGTLRLVPLRHARNVSFIYVRRVLRRLYTHVPKLPQFPNGYHPKTGAEKPLWKIAQLCLAGNTPKNL